ncbi:branched-chain amino acid ABC transporter permease [Streptomyces sp. NPDC057253]|uniref:branched-chain amino acid ABC transporter permease n=1 Tax=Streptomyces sp. NPDC057253 TaxID=3346069 RepID=UPI003627B207
MKTPSVPAGVSKALWPAAALAALAVAAFALAPVLSLGQLDLSVTLLTYLTIAQAWNVLAGFSGQISLGAAAFMATGGYTTALILAHTGLPWPVAFLGAGVGAALLALLLAVPLLRLRGDYFAVGTLAVSIAIQALLSNWNWAGGASGLTLPTERIPSGGNLYQIAVLVAALAMALTLYVRHSAFGLRIAAVRDNEPAAAGLGVSVYRHRLAALVPTSALTGLAGAVIAFQFVVISPDGVASVNWSLNAVLMSVVGGAGTVLGPVAGVGIVYYGLTRALQNQQTLSMVIEGVLLIAIVRFAPQGAWPLICRAIRLPLTRRRAALTATDTGSNAITRTPEHA